MPQAKTTTASGFQIVVDKPCTHIYLPGQTLSGRVQLTTADDVPIGCVWITFYGRAKAKIHQNNGESESIYRSRANYFSIETELFHSTHTFKAGQWEWPFSFTCPHIADEAALRSTSKELKGTKFRKSAVFLDFEELSAHGTGGTSVDPTDGMGMAASMGILGHDLPPAMQYYHGMWGRRAYGFVEYVLEASLREPEEKRRMWGMRDPKRHISSRVINFVPGRKQDVLKQGQIDVKEEAKTVVIKAPKLDFSSPTTPDLSTVSSHDSYNPIQMTESRTEKMLSLFPRLSLTPTNTASSTKLGLIVNVEHPTTFQVYHPDPITFKIGIKLDPTYNVGLDRSRLPSITIKTFTLHLICCTRVRSPGLLRDHVDGKTVPIKLADNRVVNQRVELAPSSLANPSPTEKSEKQPASGFSHTFSANLDPPTVDLGALADLKLQGAQLGKINEPILAPTFITYNILREYGLKWSVELEVEGQPGKTERVTGEVEKGGIKVVAIADSIRERVSGMAPGVAEVDVEALTGKDADEEDDGERTDEKMGRGNRKKGGGVHDRSLPVDEEKEEDGEQLPRYSA